MKLLEVLVEEEEHKELHVTKTFQHLIAFTKIVNEHYQI